MIINYTHKKSTSYDLVTTEQDTYIVATRKASYNVHIPIYKNGDNSRTLTFGTNLVKSQSAKEEDKIYTTLENISSNEEKIKFCNTYGTLVNHKSPIPYKLNFRINTALQAKVDELVYLRKENESTTNHYFENDCMKDEHFTYYIKTLQLITKLSPHAHRVTTYENCFPLVDFIMNYIPLTHEMLFQEYDCYDDGFPTFLQAYPFYNFVFTCYKLNTNGSLPKNELALAPSEYPLYTLIRSRLDCLTPLQTSKEITLSEIANLFTDIYADVINFHMKNIPFSIITPFMKTQSLSFYTLGDAILFQKILDETQAIRPLICPNELCQKIFWPKGGHYQIYCTPHCGQKDHKRKYKQKKAGSMRKMQSPSKISK